MGMTDAQDLTLTKLAGRRGGIQSFALHPSGDVLVSYENGSTYRVAEDGRAVRSRIALNSVERLTEQQEAITRVLLKRHLRSSMEEGKPVQYVGAIAGALRVLDHAWLESGPDANASRTQRLLAQAEKYDRKARLEALEQSPLKRNSSTYWRLHKIVYPDSTVDLSTRQNREQALVRAEAKEEAARDDFRI